ncbi:hypothetical protein SISNIDRAFT_450268 [Sistotremastrum niveocremeum HHB9708]|uniref:F-box domain-containing protein n=1 Tax=Sistotremastrum niveocremeum HHB9708 TaxID=1314777 RepID=A0A164Z216_9AGAM|nr:hypothetical protein SISNIDRAFT_450268 [Sistotremastrum niveocremeum HHB9708]
MGSIAIPRLYEALREATDAADAEVDAHFHTVLRNVDISTEPISSSLLILRRAAREAAIKRIRVTAALQNLLHTQHNMGTISRPSLVTYRSEKIKAIAEGVAMDTIIYSTEPESIVLRMELNQQTPINRIPAELIGMIFEECVLSLWDNLVDLSKTHSLADSGSKARLVTPVRISHVCSHWRYAALGNGNLWSRFYQCWPQDVVSAFLQRSQSSLLEIVTLAEERKGYQDGVKEITPFLSKHMSALKRIVVRQGYVHHHSIRPAIFNQFNAIWEHRAPTLRHVHLSSAGHPPEVPDIGLALFQNFPNLETIYLEAFRLPNLGDLPALNSLTSLTLRLVVGESDSLSLQDLHTLLTRTPNLEYLALWDLRYEINASEDQWPKTSVDLLRCRDVHLDLANFVSLIPFFSTLTFPNVDNLTVKHSSAVDPLFTLYQSIPSYLCDIVLKSASLFIAGRPGNIIAGPVAKYIVEDDHNLAGVKNTISFQGTNPIPSIGKVAEVRQDMPPVIASVVMHLPLGHITHLGFEDFASAPVAQWKTALYAFDAVTHLEVFRMIKKTTTNLCKALGDPKCLPKLRRFDIDFNGFNAKDLNKAFSSRNKKESLHSLYIFDLDQFHMHRSTEPMRQIASVCAATCYTNRLGLEEF